MTKRYTISIDDETGEWLEGEVGSKRFRNISHGFEFCVNDVKGNFGLTKMIANLVFKPGIEMKDILILIEDPTNLLVKGCRFSSKGADKQ